MSLSMQEIKEMNKELIEKIGPLIKDTISQISDKNGILTFYDLEGKEIKTKNVIESLISKKSTIDGEIVEYLVLYKVKVLGESNLNQLLSLQTTNEYSIIPKTVLTTDNRNYIEDISTNKEDKVEGSYSKEVIPDDIYANKYWGINKPGLKTEYEFLEEVSENYNIDIDLAMNWYYFFLTPSLRLVKETIKFRQMIQKFRNLGNITKLKEVTLLCTFKDFDKTEFDLETYMGMVNNLDTYITLNKQCEPIQSLLIYLTMEELVKNKVFK